MRQFITTILATMIGVVAAAILLVVLAGMVISAQLADLVRAQTDTPQSLDGAVILEVDLRQPRLDQPSRSLLPSSNALSLIEIVETLGMAADDDKVAGVFVRTGDGVTPADAEDIHRALARISRAGKPVLAHIQSMTGGSTSGYLAVSGADDIWMHPGGWFAATGLRTEQVFLGDGLARAGADAQFLQLYEYKGAAEIFTRSGYSDEAREATAGWLGSLYETAIVQIAEDRSFSPDTAASLISAGPHLASEALESGLVDTLGHAEAAREAAVTLTAGGTVEPIADYARRNAAPTGGAVIALISGQGMVVDGPAPSGLASPTVLASDTMAAAIDEAAADPDVAAILIRLDTGGGSATASNQIAAAILRARQDGTPVVVSFGSVAASGGYYIAAPADHIVANAGSLTGSIGVISGKIAFGPALERYGITTDSVTVGGEFTGAMSPSEAYSETQRAAIEAWAEATYRDFTVLVAEGRDLPLSRVEDIARGRVWTGAQALELGLVDEIGGFHEAVASARRLARLSADERVELRAYPAPPTGLERVRAILSGGASTAESLETLSDVLARPEVQALLRESQRGSSAPVSLEAEPAAPR